MSNPFDPYDGSEFRNRFFDGLRLFRNSDYTGALVIFREIVAAADKRDVYLNKYRSFAGLARVCMGEKSGVEQCREAAADELHDVEVHYNLALAEFKLDNRRRTVAAVQRALSIDAVHPETLRLRAIMGARRRPVIPFLGRDHFLNKWLGKLTYRKPKR